MCVRVSVCFLIVTANISGGASLSLALPRSQSADVVWPAGLPSLRLTVTNNKNTLWLASSSSVCPLPVLEGWRAWQAPNSGTLHMCVFENHYTTYIMWLQETHLCASQFGDNHLDWIANLVHVHSELDISLSMEIHLQRFIMGLHYYHSQSEHCRQYYQLWMLQKLVSCLSL